MADLVSGCLGRAIDRAWTLLGNVLAKARFWGNLGQSLKGVAGESLISLNIPTPSVFLRR